MRKSPCRGAGAKIILLLITIFASMASAGVQAQSIFLKKGQFGVMPLAGYGASDKYCGPVMGLGVSFNGFTELDLSYSNLSHEGSHAFTFSIAPDFLLRKQSASFPVNVELFPGFSRTHYRNTSYASGEDNNIFSFGMAVSGELKGVPGIHFIPLVHALYSIVMFRDKRYNYSDINSNENLITAGLDVNIGIDLSDHILLVFDPGITFAINENSTAGSIAGGLLIN